MMRSRTQKSQLLWREAIDGYLCILPWLLGFLIFTAGPMIASIVMAGMEWEVITPPRWAALANVRRLVGDDLFMTALWNTAFYTSLAVPLNLLAALAAAMLLNTNVRGTNLYRAIIYLPSQIPAVANAMLWFFIFSPTYGLANDVLNFFGLPGQKWLWDVHLVKPSFVLMAAWALGGGMIIFLAGLQGIPAMLYEAAEIDGAGAWHKFLNVTLPMLSPTIFFNLVMGIIGSFQIFTQAYLMTNGGPGNASLMLVLYIYRSAFEHFKMGYASLMAWILFLVVLAFTLLQFKLSNMWVFYEGEVK